MSIRKGDVVSHCKAMEWGVGLVVEVTPYRVSVQFNDGITRKIAGAYVTNLLPAEPASYVPAPPPVAKVATKKAAPRTKKAAASK